MRPLDNCIEALLSRRLLLPRPGFPHQPQCRATGEPRGPCKLRRGKAKLAASHVLERILRQATILSSPLHSTFSRLPPIPQDPCDAFCCGHYLPFVLAGHSARSISLCADTFVCASTPIRASPSNPDDLIKMGIPAAFRWFSNKYPKIISPVIEDQPITMEDGSTIPVDTTRPNPNGEELDNLYLDMNGIVHPCSHPEDRPAPKDEEEMMLEVFRYTDRVVNMVRPRKILMIAVGT
ncbi:5'-3' exoribonuclease 2 [Ilyonectria robusta]